MNYILYDFVYFPLIRAIHWWRLFFQGTQLVRDDLPTISCCGLGLRVRVKVLGSVLTLA